MISMSVVGRFLCNYLCFLPFLVGNENKHFFFSCVYTLMQWKCEMLY